MPRPKSTFGEQLSAAQLTLANSRNDAEIKALVAPFGYTDEKLSEGQALSDAARAAVSAQAAAAGEQLAATQGLLAAQGQATAAYQDLAKLARAVTDRSAQAQLGLGGRMPLAIGAFLTAAGTLFDNAANLPVLAQYGYDAARLSTERAKINAYSAANQQQETAKSRAKAATQTQNEAITALNKWMAQYIKIARVALRARPDMLTRLGLSPVRQPARKKTDAGETPQ